MMHESAPQERREMGLPKVPAIAYVVVVALLCLVPSVGLLVGGSEVSSDTNAAPAPQLVRDDGSVNFNVMADAGAWFDDHFAFRNEWVTAAAAVAARVHPALNHGLFTLISMVSPTAHFCLVFSITPSSRRTAATPFRTSSTIAFILSLLTRYGLSALRM